MKNILRAITPPTGFAVSVSDARRHLRLEQLDDDAAIAVYIEAAQASLAYLNRAILPASYAYDLYCTTPIVEIPMPPLRQVTAVRLPDNSLIASTNYRVTTTSQGRGIIQPVTGYSWPTPLSGSLVASIEFDAGYVKTPSAIRSAILLIVGALFENRSAASPVSLTELPFGVDRLVSVYQEQFV